MENKTDERKLPDIMSVRRWLSAVGMNCHDFFLTLCPCVFSLPDDLVALCFSFIKYREYCRLMCLSRSFNMFLRRLLDRVRLLVIRECEAGHVAQYCRGLRLLQLTGRDPDFRPAINRLLLNNPRLEILVLDSVFNQFLP